jgi:hypothetical protein
VRSFTEASSITRLVSAPPYAFAATAAGGLDQWDLRSGRAVPLESLVQLAEPILDLAYDPGRRALWIVGAEGVARYDLATGGVTRLPPPPSGESASSFLDAAVEPSPDGGVWLGLRDGLYFADATGSWQPTAIDTPVAALHLDAAGTLLVGTAAGLMAIDPGAAPRWIDCPLARVRTVVAAPGGAFAIGEDEVGEQRVAYLSGEGCEGFRVSPARRLRDAASDGERVLLLTSEGLYQLVAREPRRQIRRLARDGMTLIPLAPSAEVGAGRLAQAPLELSPVAAEVPAGAHTVAISGREVLVGTLSLGTARISLGGDPRASPRWLRRSELARSAVHLSVVCGGERDCSLANGSGGLWRFDGERFARREGATPVIGVVEIDGSIFRLTARHGEPSIEIVRPGEGGAAASLSLPDGVELRALEAGPRGSLLVGWVAAGAAPGDPLVGASWIDLAGGGELRLDGPIHDLTRCGEHVFVASGGGVLEIGGRLRIVDGGPVLRLACDRDQRLIIATATRIARAQDGAWVELVRLTEPVRDLAVAGDDRLFLATGDGVGVWDGAKVRRYDVRRGLIDNDVLEIALDRFNRVWLRGRTGLGLIRL